MALYVYNSSGAPNVLASWDLNTIGSGTHPLNFTTASVTYNFIGTGSATLTATWIITGTGSTVIIGDGTNVFTFSDGGFTFTATVTVSTNSIIKPYIYNTGAPNVLTSWDLGTIGSGVHPNNFTSGHRTYNFNGTGSATMTANWTVNGAVVLVNIGDGTNVFTFSDGGFSVISILTNFTVNTNSIIKPYIYNTGAPNVLTSWNLGTIGSGVHPNNFTSRYRTYNFNGTGSAILTANWTISSLGGVAVVNVGDGTNVFTLYPENNTISSGIGSSIIPFTIALHSILYQSDGTSSIISGNIVNNGDINLSGTGGSMNFNSTVINNGTITLLDNLSSISTGGFITFNNILSGAGIIKSYITANTNNGIAITYGGANFGTLHFNTDVGAGITMLDMGACGATTIVTLGSNLNIDGSGSTGALNFPLGVIKFGTYSIDVMNGSDVNTSPPAVPYYSTTSNSIVIQLTNFDNAADPPDNITYGAGNADWYVDNGIMSGLPVSNGYVGASGSYFLGAVNGNDAPTTVETATYLVSTTGYTNLQLQWGAYKDSASFPTLILEYSTDNITFTPITYTDVSANSIWALVPVISLPIGCNNQATLYLRWRFTDDGVSANYLIDDLKISGGVDVIYSALLGKSNFLMFSN